MASEDRFRPAVDLADLRESGRELVALDGRSIALFDHEGSVRAVDNACPHMGFPLARGSVDEGVLTCHWHHARFELSCGDTFDPWADDVRTYPVEVRDGTVYVDPNPDPDEPPAVRWSNRLEDGLEQNLRLVVAKSVIGLLDADVEPTEPLSTGVRFGCRYRRDGWGSGLTILTAMANVLPDLDPDDRKRALYQGLVHVAGDASGEPPQFEQDALGATDTDFDRLRSWFRENVEVRDPDGAERVLRTAIAAGRDDAELAGMVAAAATDHRYLDTGHVLDFVNKACEALDHVGWDRADEVLPGLVRGLARADRAEESAEWRRPIDLAGTLDDVFDDLDDHADAGAGETWSRPDGLLDTLLGDDPHAVVDALTEAIRSGATPAQLADVVAFAAGTRVARFSTTNEFGDWNTVHHTFTYANAVHRLAERTGARELYRGAFDAAVNVYLDRFLNTPPAPLPDPTPDADPAEALETLSAAFDAEGRVNDAGRATAGFLDGGGDPARLRRELGGALLREDAGFHTYQALEAGFRQAATRPPEEARTLLVGVARYLAAHSPTRREREQTFGIAARLQRGESVYGEDVDI
ncbi:ferredoxin subunit of nitrite reductase and ring-hydroxylating dioxygenase [Haloferax gibbonsii ATCC 33959]|uniref:Ferredoxin subunit of nitrite reductase and ring-hydroxylating dioxygenase n=1 Tax=Haloferax gibbonsii (strain ATCC 33959 / DSM 4427 / JCM 8863 / NBRC 102184 / NCIMB 2188 / Ma 2.38) TaxID=1227459 RepID=M0H8R5_HALGM|nr:Rieske (2Fe-2S) protein [Haloferax gibbonsii]ELZ80193.1 ferredoxin subunit of nitrite reductase and ring-hydroxylating dioxygenase [Haloferax gibbonsii ATCC 33959]